MKCRITDKLVYNALLEEDEDGGFIASIPELLGCISQGETPGDAFARLNDALAGWLEVAQRHGLQIPLPRSNKDDY